MEAIDAVQGSEIEGPPVSLRTREQERSVRGGIPELPLSELPPAAGRLPAGTGASLLGRDGRPLGAGIADPERGAFRVWSREPVGRFDRGFFRRKVAAALERRRALLADPRTDAIRLIHGDGDGLSGIAVDAWGRFLVSQAFGPGPARWIAAVEEALRERLDPQGIVRKHVFPEGKAGARGGGERTRLERGKVEEAVVAGERPPDELRVLENGVPFLVRLVGARHAGLFTDMREERARLLRFAAGRRVLNTFAYTGGFSVAAALGGATEVVSVDLVAKVLEWAKENFRLSGLDPGRHRFTRMDTLEYLALARRKGWLFDAIVLDPPTFAAQKGRRWSIRRDYPALIRQALGILSPGGLIWICANTSEVGAAEVEGWIESGSEAAGRTLRTVARAGQPEDHRGPPGFPRYRYLKIHVLRG